MILRLGCLVVALSAMACCAAGASDKRADPPAGGRKLNVLFLKGGASHDFEGLPPLLANMLRRTGNFDVTLTGDWGYLEPERIRPFHVLVMYTQGGELSEKQKEGLLEWVAAGGGMVGIHGATATFKQSEDYWKLVGGRFIGHDYLDFEVLNREPDHPITRFFTRFTVKDEDYRHDFHPDAKIHPLAVRLDGQPVMWTREYGRGRVFINALGHDAGVFNNRNFQVATVRGVYWAAGYAPGPVPPAWDKAPIQNPPSE